MSGVRPLDPRLLRHAAGARHWVAAAAGLQVLVAALVVAQALLLADALAGVVAAGRPASSVRGPAATLALVVGGRALVAWAQQRYATRAATTVIAQLRAAVLTHLADAGPAALDGPAGAATTTLLTRGLDALDGYLVRYLPQLLATALVTPALVAVVLVQDPASAALMALTLPLVPVLMALVGWSTQRLAGERLRRMEQLGAQLLDLVAGLTTLRALGRAGRQVERVRAVGQAYRASTMAVLRQAFLSGLVLEVFTTLSVAVVAVGVGLRLLGGTLDLRTALVVLVLAPEVYLPLRLVGQYFHASTDGLAAAGEAFAVLDSPTRPGPTPGSPTPGSPTPGLAALTGPVTAVRWDDVSVVHAGRVVAAPAGLRAQARAGRVTALVGANGAGKSTAVALALGLRAPTRGRVLLTTAEGGSLVERDLREVDRDSWQRQVAWAPQRPAIVAGTLADNLRLVAPDATEAELDAAAARVGLLEVVAGRPGGWSATVGTGGVGLSAGQRQRLALARVLLRVARGAGVVVLDEPTAHLDPRTEDVVLRTVRELADAGALVLVVAHRTALRAVADDVAVVVSTQIGASADLATSPASVTG